MTDITSLLENAAVETLLHLTDEKPNLIKINRGNFKDMIIGADGSKVLKDSEIDMYLRMLSDEDFISIVEPAFEKGQYQRINEDAYKLLDESYQKGKKSVFLYVSDSHLTKLLIATYVKYEWILKAMAIDYSKYLDMPLTDTFQEYFDGNNRIIESTLLEGKYQESDNHWKIDEEQSVLIYNLGKKSVIWTKGEAEYRFEELKNM